MFNKKKGQTALEFLITYGWAIMVVLIMMAALNYFGFFRIERYLPQSTSFPYGIDVDDFLFSAQDETILVLLTNDNGFDMVVTNIKIDFVDGNNPLFCGTINTNLPFEWLEGETLELNYSQCYLESIGIYTNTKATFNTTINYYAKGSSINYIHDLYGEIYANID
jgi:hypothetical protein